MSSACNKLGRGYGARPARCRFVLLLLLLSAACGPRYGTATLRWDAVEADLVAGYNVYRSEEVDRNYLRLNTDLLQEPRYVDETAMRGKTYYYRVTAVSSAGAESDLSEPVSKTID